MKLRLCCVSSRIEGVPDDFFFVVFVVELSTDDANCHKLFG